MVDTVNDNAYDSGSFIKNTKEIKMKTNRRLLAVLMVAAVGALNLSFMVPQNAEAAALTDTYLRLNRMTAGTATDMRLVFKAKSTSVSTVSINMNNTDSPSWTTTGSGAVNATQTVSSAGCAAQASATALPGSLTAAGSGSTITISGVTTLTIGTLYCVDLTSASSVTNPTAGEYHPLITAGADSVTVGVRTVSNDSVTVSATVPPTFNFALSANSDSFTTNLSSSAVTSTTGVNVTVNTNAKTGWIAWVKDSSNGLNSAAAVKTIASVTAGSSSTLTAGTEGYGVGVTSVTPGSGAGTITVATAYDATASAGVNNTVGGVDGTLRQLASSSGTASGAVLAVKERAAISALTPAASDYTDTVTLIGAASF